ncbi:hypothetical protein Bca101_033064 [Brassica carinata]
MGSLKKKAINASTKLKHSLKKTSLVMDELLLPSKHYDYHIIREKEKSQRRGEESAKDVSSDSREGISFLRKQLDHKRFKELLELHHNKHVGSVCNSCQGSS